MKTVENTPINEKSLSELRSRIIEKIGHPHIKQKQHLPLRTSENLMGRLMMSGDIHKNPREILKEMRPWVREILTENELVKIYRQYLLRGKYWFRCREGESLKEYSKELLDKMKSHLEVQMRADLYKLLAAMDAVFLMRPAAKKDPLRQDVLDFLAKEDHDASRFCLSDGGETFSRLNLDMETLSKHYDESWQLYRYYSEEKRSDPEFFINQVLVYGGEGAYQAFSHCSDTLKSDRQFINRILGSRKPKAWKIFIFMSKELRGEPALLLHFLKADRDASKLCHSFEFYSEEEDLAAQCDTLLRGLSELVTAGYSLKWLQDCLTALAERTGVIFACKLFEAFGQRPNIWHVFKSLSRCVRANGDVQAAAKACSGCDSKIIDTWAKKMVPVDIALLKESKYCVDDVVEILLTLEQTTKLYTSKYSSEAVRSDPLVFHGMLKRGYKNVWRAFSGFLFDPSQPEHVAVFQEVIRHAKQKISRSGWFKKIAKEANQPLCLNILEAAKEVANGWTLCRFFSQDMRKNPDVLAKLKTLRGFDQGLFTKWQAEKRPKKRRSKPSLFSTKRSTDQKKEYEGEHSSFLGGGMK